MSSKLFEGRAVWFSALKPKWVDARVNKYDGKPACVAITVEGFTAFGTPEETEKLASDLFDLATQARERFK
jgi:hypothetical protein